jgi:uncharacterized linocin/CFP29 family protein
MDQAMMDLIRTAGGNISAIGDVATRLLASSFNVAALRTCRVLRREEWILFDQTVVEIARQRLVAVGELVSRGLTFNLPNALGTTRLEWERISDMTPAEISMSGIKEGEADRVAFDLSSLPIPIIHKDFHINIRALETSRRFGQPLDTTMAALATRKVAEQAETILFNGLTVSSTNGVIYGYLNAPNANTGSLTAAWDAGTTTGANILADVLAMVEALQVDHMWGPYGLYVPQDYWIKLVDDFKANSDRTILERIMAIPGIAFVQPTEGISSTLDTVVMFQLTSDVVRMIMGMQPTLIEWESHGGLVTNFKVMAIMVPNFRNDYEGQSGVAVYSV